MSLVRYEPMSILNRMQSELNDFFKFNGNRLMPDMFSESNMSLDSNWLPSVDIKEDAKHFVISADVPGVDPKDIRVSMENGYLTIAGSRSTEKEKSDENFRLKEVSYGAFERRFALPDTADADAISAKNKNGVLTISIGKKKGVQPKLIEIKS